MVTQAQSERTTSQPVRVNITDTDNPQAQRTTIHCRWRIRVSHVINVIIIALVVAILVITEMGYIPSTKLGYTCNDPLISHKFKGDTISGIVLLVGSALLPLLVLLFTEVLTKQSCKKLSINELLFYYKEYLIGAMLVVLITEVAKVLVGEHRPYFIDVCEPDTNVNCVNGSFIEDYKCTSTRYGKHFLADASRSFPSGHASVSVFVGLFSAIREYMFVFIALLSAIIAALLAAPYIVQTRLLTVKTGRLLKPFLASMCLMWSLVCSLTRITDRRHHWWDVLAGTFLGALCALYSLKLIHNKVNNIDKPSRISTSTTTLLDVKNKDATSVII